MLFKTGIERNGGSFMCVLCTDTGISISFRQQTSHLCANEETVTLNWRERMLMDVLLGFKEKILPNAVEN